MKPFFPSKGKIPFTIFVTNIDPNPQTVGKMCVHILMSSA